MIKHIQAIPYLYNSPGIKRASKEPEWLTYIKDLYEGNFAPIPQNILQYEPDKYIYFQALAIFGGQKFGANDNGDYFSIEELEKSYLTFIGKGVYIEHREDSPNQAVGLIFDAQFIKEGFVVVSGFLDKTYYNKYKDYIEKPDFKVSMSVAVGSYRCMSCGKKYINLSNRCIHTKNFLGTTYKGEFIAEENFNLHFTGLSLVEIPGEPKVQAQITNDLLFLDGIEERTDEAIRAQYESTLKAIDEVRKQGEQENLANLGIDVSIDYSGLVENELVTAGKHIKKASLNDSPYLYVGVTNNNNIKLSINYSSLPQNLKNILVLKKSGPSYKCIEIM